MMTDHWCDNGWDQLAPLANEPLPYWTSQSTDGKKNLPIFYFLILHPFKLPGKHKKRPHNVKYDFISTAKNQVFKNSIQFSNFLFLFLSRPFIRVSHESAHGFVLKMIESVLKEFLRVGVQTLWRQELKQDQVELPGLH